MKQFLLMLLGGWLISSTACALPTKTVAATSQLKDPAVIAQGQYLAHVGNCISCHTLGGKTFAGGRALPTPFGTIYSPNITPDEITGIGNWSFDEFWQALHNGVGHEGQLLYPVFSYTSYTKVTRDDAFALYAYLNTVPAIHQPNKEHGFGFPYNIRSTLYVWRSLYFKAGEYQPDPAQSEQWNRGAYLVQGLGHCNECHTTRNALGAMDQKNQLSGGQIPIQGWYAPNLSMQKGGDLEGWSVEDMMQLLRTGISAKGGALGPMAEVVRNSTQYYSDDDLKAVALYLNSLPAPQAKPAIAVVKASDYVVGQKLYQDNCASCHGEQGQGELGIYPTLAGNPTVTEPTGVNATRSVLLGGFSPATIANPEPYSMPPFAGQFNSEEVAAVVNYIRQSFGNQANPVDVPFVAKQRAYRP